MNRSAGKICALGEVALRVNDLDAMVEFYESVLQLNLMRRAKSFAFFNLAEGYAGHTQVLALFDRSESDDYEASHRTKTTVDHIAFTISLRDFEGEKKRLMGLGCELTFAEHGWVQWRSLYLSDPDGNTVELVCFDERIKQIDPVDD